MAHTKVTKTGTQNTGTANTFSYSGSFDVFKASEIEVELANIKLTFTTGTINESASPREYTVDYGNKTIHIGGADLTSSDTVVIQPITDMGAPTPRATYEPGASITSTDLNNNQLQLMRKVMEYEQQLMSSRGATMTGNLHLGQNVDLTFEGDTDNAYETTLTVADPTADRTITLPNTTGTVVTTGDTATVTATMLAANSVDSSELVDGSIDTSHIGDSQVTTAKITDANVTTAKLATDAVTTAKITDANVTTAKIANDAVTADKLANTAVTAGSYTATDLTVDAQGRITSASNGTIGTSEIAADAIDGTKIADDSIDSEHYVDGSIDTDHIADNQITTAKIVDSNITTVKIADNNITTAKIAGANVTDAKLASNSVTTSKITDGNVTTVKIADSGITLAKLTGDLRQPTISNSNTEIPTSGAVVSYVAAQIAPIGGLEVIADEVSFPDSQPSAGVVISISDAAGVVVNGSGTSTTGRTVSNSTVTINNFPTSLDNETLASGVGLMVSSTGSSQTYNYHKILAAETDVKQLSDDINDFNARYRVGSSNPTSALDDGDLFFNTGTGKMLVYNASNSAWEEVQSVGNFYINTISSYSGTGGNSASFNGSAYRFVLSNAPTNAEQLLVSVNGVVQKPNSGTSQPGEGFAIDGSSIIFSSAPATGSDFFIITIGSTVNIGTPSDNTVTTAKLTSGAVTTAKIADANVTTAKIADDAITAAKLASDAVVSASIVDGSIVNADINASAAIARTKLANVDLVDDTSPQLGGDLQSNGNDIDFADNDKAIFGTGSDLKIYHDGTDNVIEATGNLKIIESGGGTGTSAKFVENGEVELWHNQSKRFETTSFGAEFFGDAGIARTAGGYTFREVAGGGERAGIHSNASNELIFKTNGAAEVAKLTSSNLQMNDNNKIQLGTSQDLQFFHDGTDSHIQNTNNSGELKIRAHQTDIKNADNNETQAIFHENGAVELYYDNTKRFETTSSGILVEGDASTGSIIQGDLRFKKAGSSTTRIQWRGDEQDLKFNDDYKATFGGGNDLQIYHDGSNSYLINTTGFLKIKDESNVRIDTDAFAVNKGDNSEAMIVATANGATELYYDGSKKLETTTTGIQVYSDEHSHARVQSGNATTGNTATLGLGPAGNLIGTYLISEAESDFSTGANRDAKFTIQNRYNGTFYSNLEINKTGQQDNLSFNNGGDHFVFRNTTTSNTGTMFTIVSSRNTTNNSYKLLVGGSTSATRFVVKDSGDVQNTNNSYGSLSDQTLKENIVDAGSQWDDIKNLKVRKFNFIETTDPDKKTMLGVVAQEAETVCPNLVETNLTKQNGEEKEYKSFKYSVLYMKAIKALQEAMEKIETLETKVAALEAA